MTDARRVHVFIHRKDDRFDIDITSADGKPIGRRSNAPIGPDAEVPFDRDRTIQLRELIDRLVDFHRADLEDIFRVEGQRAVGRFLFDAVFGEFDRKTQDDLIADPIDLRIVTDDEHVAALPWVLLARGPRLMTTQGWSISLTERKPSGHCSLPPSPKLLVVAPEPTATYGRTDADRHAEDVVAKLAHYDDAYARDDAVPIVRTWNEFRDAVSWHRPNIVYYYGHGTGDRSGVRLVFEKKNRQPDERALADVRGILTPSTPDTAADASPPTIVYVNACHGDTGAFLGAGFQLDRIPAVVSNRTTAKVGAAQAQAVSFLKKVVVEGRSPSRAVTEFQAKTVDNDLSFDDVRWMTPVVHCRYGSFTSHPTKKHVFEERDPNWRHNFDRRSIYGMITNDVSDMLKHARPPARGYLWYGVAGQGVDTFRRRLAEEVPRNFRDVRVKAYHARWPLALDHSDAYEQMTNDAVGISRLDNVVGQIKHDVIDQDGARTVAVFLHDTIDPGMGIKPSIVREYLEWWNHAVAPLLSRAEHLHAVVALAFRPEKPGFAERLRRARLDELETSLTNLQFEIVPELGNVTKSDILHFLGIHDFVDAAHRKRVVDEIFDKTNGHYAETLDELADLARRRFSRSRDDDLNKDTDDDDDDF